MDQAIDEDEEFFELVAALGVWRLPLLASIDPYSDTAMARQAAQGLVQEIQIVLASAPSGAAREFAEAVERMARRCATGDDLELRWTGD